MNLPPEVRSVAKYLIGVWPAADEDQLRVLSQVHRAVAEDARALHEAMAGGPNGVRGWEGEAREAHDRLMDRLLNDSGLAALADSAEKIAEGAYETAAQVEKAKLQAIFFGLYLVASIAWAVANAVETLGGSLVWLAGVEIVVSELLSQVGRFLLEAVIAAGLGALVMAGADVLAQGVVLGKGHSDHFDWGSVLKSAGMGALMGAVAHGVGTAIGAGSRAAYRGIAGGAGKAAAGVEKAALSEGGRAAERTIAPGGTRDVVAAAGQPASALSRTVGGEGAAAAGREVTVAGSRAADTAAGSAAAAGSREVAEGAAQAAPRVSAGRVAAGLAESVVQAGAGGYAGMTAGTTAMGGKTHTGADGLTTGMAGGLARRVGGAHPIGAPAGLAASLAHLSALPDAARFTPFEHVQDAGRGFSLPGTTRVEITPQGNFWARPQDAGSAVFDAAFSSAVRTMGTDDGLPRMVVGTPELPSGSGVAHLESTWREIAAAPDAPARLPDRVVLATPVTEAELPALHAFVTQHQVEVRVPSGPVLAGPDGALFVTGSGHGDAAGGRWTTFSPPSDEAGHRTPAPAPPTAAAPSAGHPATAERAVPPAPRMPGAAEGRTGPLPASQQVAGAGAPATGRTGAAWADVHSTETTGRDAGVSRERATGGGASQTGASRETATAGAATGPVAGAPDAGQRTAGVPGAGPGSAQVRAAEIPAPGGRAGGTPQGEALTPPSGDRAAAEAPAAGHHTTELPGAEAPASGQRATTGQPAAGPRATEARAPAAEAPGHPSAEMPSSGTAGAPGHSATEAPLPGAESATPAARPDAPASPADRTPPPDPGPAAPVPGERTPDGPPPGPVRTRVAGAVLDAPAWERALQAHGDGSGLPAGAAERLGAMRAERIPAGILLRDPAGGAGLFERPEVAATLRSLAPDPRRLTVIAPDAAAARALHTLVDALPPGARDSLRLVMPERGLDHAASLLRTVPGIREVIAADGPVKLTGTGYAHVLPPEHGTPGSGAAGAGQWQRVTRTEEQPAPGAVPRPDLTAEPVGALFPSPAWDQILTTATRYGTPEGLERIPAGLVLTGPATAGAFDAARLLPDPGRVTVAGHGDLHVPEVRRRVEDTVRDLAALPGTRALRLAWDGAALATGKRGRSFLQDLADRYQVDITAPDGRIDVLEGGASLVTGPDGGHWQRFRPGRETASEGAVFPPLAWHEATEDAAAVPVTGARLRSVAAGLWIDATTDPATAHPGMPAAADIRALAPSAEGPVVVVTADPAAPGTRTALDQVLGRLSARPDTAARVRLLVSHPAADAVLPGRPGADLAAASAHHAFQRLADTHGLTLRVAEGAWSPGRAGTPDGLRPTTADGPEGRTPVWRDYRPGEEAASARAEEQPPGESPFSPSAGERPAADGVFAPRAGERPAEEGPFPSRSEERAPEQGAPRPRAAEEPVADEASPSAPTGPSARSPEPPATGTALRPGPDSPPPAAPAPAAAPRPAASGDRSAAVTPPPRDEFAAVSRTEEPAAPHAASPRETPPAPTAAPHGTAPEPPRPTPAHDPEDRPARDGSEDAAPSRDRSSRAPVDPPAPHDAPAHSSEDRPTPSDSGAQPPLHGSEDAAPPRETSSRAPETPVPAGDDAPPAASGGPSARGLPAGLAVAGRFGTAIRLMDTEVVYERLAGVLADAVRQGGHPESVVGQALSRFDVVRRAVGDEEFGDWLAHGGYEVTTALPDAGRYRVHARLLLPADRDAVREIRPATVEATEVKRLGKSWDPEYDSRVTGTRGKAVTWKLGGSVTDVMPPATFAPTIGIPFSGSRTTSVGSGDMSIGAARLTPPTGDAVHFTFPGVQAEVTVRREATGGPAGPPATGPASAAPPAPAVRSAPFDVRIEAAGSLVPEAPLRDGLPLHPRPRDTYVLTGDGPRTAAEQRRLDDAMWTHLAAPEAIDGLEGLHARVLDHLDRAYRGPDGHPDTTALTRGSEAAWRLRRFLSERVQLYGIVHHSGIGHASETFPLNGGAHEVGVTVRAHLVSARRVDHTESGQRTETGDRPESGDRTETGDRTEPGGRTETDGRTESGATESGGRRESGERAEPGDRTETGDRTESGGATEKKPGGATVSIQQRTLHFAINTRSGENAAEGGLAAKAGGSVTSAATIKAQLDFHTGGSTARSLELDQGPATWQQLSTTGPSVVYELGVTLVARLWSNLKGATGEVTHPGTVHLRLPVADVRAFEAALRSEPPGPERPPPPPSDAALLPPAVREHRGAGPTHVELSGSARQVQEKVLELIVAAWEEQGSRITPLERHHLHRQLAPDFSLAGLSVHGGKLFTPRGLRRVLELPSGRSAAVTVTGRFDPDELLSSGVRADRTVRLVKAMAHSVEHSGTLTRTQRAGIEVSAKLAHRAAVDLSAGAGYSQRVTHSLATSDFVFATTGAPAISGPSKWLAYAAGFDIAVTVGPRGRTGPHPSAPGHPPQHTRAAAALRRVVTRHASVDDGEVRFWAPESLLFNTRTPDFGPRRAEVAADPREFATVREREQLGPDDLLISVNSAAEVAGVLTGILTRITSFPADELASVVDRLTDAERLMALFQRGIGDGAVHTELFRDSRTLREHGLVVRIRAELGASRALPGEVSAGRMSLHESTPQITAGMAAGTNYTYRAGAGIGVGLPWRYAPSFGVAGSYSRGSAVGMSRLQKVTSGGLTNIADAPHTHHLADVIYTVEVEHRRTWDLGVLGSSQRLVHERASVKVPDALEFLRRAPRTPASGTAARSPLDARTTLLSQVPYALRFDDAARHPGDERAPGDNPLVDAVVGLLRHHPAFAKLMGDAADSRVPLRAESALVESLHQMLSPTSLLGAVRRMLGTGLRLNPLGADGPYFVEVTAVPVGELTHVGTDGDMSVGRYLNTFDWAVTSESATRAKELSAHLGGTGKPPGAGRVTEPGGNLTFARGGSRTTSRKLYEGPTLVDTVTFPQGAQLYTGDLRVTLAVKRVAQPLPMLLNTLLGGVPDRVRSAYHRAGDPHPDDIREVTLKQHVAVAEALHSDTGALARPARPGVERLTGAADTTPVRPFPLPAAELPRAVHERHLVLKGLDDLSVREMYEQFLGALRGESGGGLLSRLRPSDAELLTEWGTMSEEALRNALSSPFLSGFFDRTLATEGFQPPGVVRGGVLSDTHGHLTVRAELFDATSLGQVIVNHELEDNGRSRQVGSAGTGRTAGTTADGTATGKPGEASLTGAPTAGRTSARSAASSVTTHALLGPNRFVERAEQVYLHVRAGIAYTLTLETSGRPAAGTRPDGSFTFRLRDSVELLVHPEKAPLFEADAPTGTRDPGTTPEPAAPADPPPGTEPDPATGAPAPRPADTPPTDTPAPDRDPAPRPDTPDREAPAEQHIDISPENVARGLKALGKLSEEKYAQVMGAARDLLAARGVNVPDRALDLDAPGDQAVRLRQVAHVLHRHGDDAAHALADSFAPALRPGTPPGEPGRPTSQNSALSQVLRGDDPAPRPPDTRPAPDAADRAREPRPVRRDLISAVLSGAADPREPRPAAPETIAGVLGGAHDGAPAPARRESPGHPAGPAPADGPALPWRPRIVIGRDAAAEELRSLQRGAPARLAEALTAAGGDVAQVDALAEQLGMTREPGLPGGMDRDAAPGTGAMGPWSFVRRVNGHVAFGGAPGLLSFLDRVPAEPAAMTVMAVVSQDGHLGAWLPNLGQTEWNAVETVRALVHGHPQAYAATAILRFVLPGHTEWNTQHVAEQLQQIAHLTRRPVWYRPDVHDLEVDGWGSLWPRGGPAPGPWRELLPDTPVHRSHEVRDDGSVEQIADRAPVGPGPQDPFFANSPARQELVLTGVLTQEGRLRISDGYGLLLRVEEEDLGVAHGRENGAGTVTLPEGDALRALFAEAEHGRTGGPRRVDLIRLHLPAAGPLAPQAHGVLAREAARLAEFLNRPVAYPGVGRVTVIEGEDVRAVGPATDGQDWVLADIRPLTLMFREGANLAQLTGHLTERGHALPAATDGLIMVAAAGPHGEITRLGDAEAVTPDTVRDEIALARAGDIPDEPLRMYLPEGVPPQVYEQFVRHVEELARRTERIVLLPPPGVRVLVDGGELTVPAGHIWKMVNGTDAVPEFFFPTDARGRARRDWPTVLTGLPHHPLETRLTAEGIRVPPVRRDRSVVFLAAGGRGEFLRYGSDRGFVSVSPEQLSEELAQHEAPVVQIYGPGPVFADVHPQFAAHARDLARLTGRTVVFPSPDTSVRVGPEPADLLVTAEGARWHVAVPDGGTADGFRTGEAGQLLAPEADFTDVHGGQWSRADVDIETTPDGYRSLRRDAGQEIGLPVPAEKTFFVALDVDHAGRPTLVTWFRELLPVSPAQLVRALWPDGVPLGQPIILARTPGDAARTIGLTAWMHDLARHLGRTVGFSEDPSWTHGELGRVDLAASLPEGYHYHWENGGALPGTLRMPGAVSVPFLEGSEQAGPPLPERIASHIEDRVTAWRGRLADRSDQLFLADLHRDPEGRLLLPGQRQQPATARQIADWVRTYGWDRSRALQLVWTWKKETGAGSLLAAPRDARLATEVASELGVPVYLPAEGGVAPPPGRGVTIPGRRDVTASSRGALLAGRWQRVDPPAGTDHGLPDFVADPYGRLVPADDRPVFAPTPSGVTLRPTHREEPPAHPWVYDVSLSLSESTGVPLIRQANGTEREATPAEVAAVLTERAATAGPLPDGERALGAWRGQTVRLLVSTPPPGPRYDRFLEWVQGTAGTADRPGEPGLRGFLNEASVRAGEGAVQVYVPEPGSVDVRAEADRRGPAAFVLRAGEDSVQPRRWVRLPGPGDEDRPAEVVEGPDGGLVLRAAETLPSALTTDDRGALVPDVSVPGHIRLTEQGALLSAATRDNTLTNSTQVLRANLHGYPMQDDPFGLVSHEGLQVLDLMVRHDGELAVLDFDSGRPVALTPGALAERLHHLAVFERGTDVQFLGRFQVRASGRVVHETQGIGPRIARRFARRMTELSRALGSDVYYPANDRGAVSLPRLLAQTGEVVAAATRGAPGVWRRAAFREGTPARFATNTYGALVPAAALRIDEAARLGIDTAEVRTEPFTGGVSLPRGSGSATASDRLMPAGREVWEWFAARDEFLVVAPGGRDRIDLTLPGGGREIPVGPGVLLEVLRGSGWDGRTALRLAVDRLAFASPRHEWDLDPDSPDEWVPGPRFGQQLADLAGVPVHAPTGMIAWDRPAGQNGVLSLDEELGEAGARIRWVTYRPSGGGEGPPPAAPEGTGTGAGDVSAGASPDAGQAGPEASGRPAVAEPPVTPVAPAVPHATVSGPEDVHRAAGESGLALSGATRHGGVADLASLGAHGGRLGLTPAAFDIASHPDLLPVDVVVAYDGEFAELAEDGRARTLSVDELAFRLRGRPDVPDASGTPAGPAASGPGRPAARPEMGPPDFAGPWEGTENIQLLGRFTGRADGTVVHGGPLPAAARETFHRRVRELATELGADVYVPAPSGGAETYRVDATGEVVVADADGRPGDWQLVAGRPDTPGPRFATNSYGALVPAASLPVEHLTWLRAVPGDVRTVPLPGGLVLPTQEHAPLPAAWREAAAPGEFLVAGQGVPDAVHLRLAASDPGVVGTAGLTVAAGPEALLQVLRAAGWDGHAPLRLAVDRLAFRQDGPPVPGDRFGRRLADLSGVTVHAAAGTVRWDLADPGAAHPGVRLPVTGRDGGGWATYVPGPGAAYPHQRPDGPSERMGR
ncbi:WXG100-like domain-containing protein [Streptomyces sp. NPDC002067]